MVFNICRVLNIIFFSEFAGLLLSVSGQNCSINSSADIFLPWFTMRYCRNDRAFFPNFSGMTLPAHSSFPGRRRCQADQTEELLFPPYLSTPRNFSIIYLLRLLHCQSAAPAPGRCGNVLFSVCLPRLLPPASLHSACILHE